MPEFAWRAAQADGQLVEGRTEATAPDAVLRHLRERGLTPIKVEDAAMGAASGAGALQMACALENDDAQVLRALCESQEMPPEDVNRALLRVLSDANT